MKKKLKITYDRVAMALKFIFLGSVAAAVVFYGKTTYKAHSAIKSAKPYMYKKSDKSIMLTPENTLSLFGEVTFSNVALWSIKLSRLAIERKSNTPIYIVVDSGGGSVEAGLSFIDFAKNFENVHTITIWAASMAAGIVEALPGKRYSTPSGSFLFHRAYASVEGQVEEGELESRLNNIKKIVLRMEKINANRIGLSLEKYKEKVKDEWILDAEDSVKLGVADSIVDVTCSLELLAETESRDISMMFGTASMVFSKCPLIRGPLK